MIYFVAKTSLSDNDFLNTEVLGAFSIIIISNQSDSAWNLAEGVRNNLNVKIYNIRHQGSLK